MPEITYKGAGIIQGLAQREISRLRACAEKSSLDDRSVFARLSAIAAISGGLSDENLESLIESKTLNFATTSLNALHDALQDAAILFDSRIEAPAPDIVAAALVSIVLAADPVSAPKTVWFGLELDLERGIAHFCRLAYDAELVLGIQDHCLSEWLSRAVEGNPERCAAMRRIVSETRLPIGLIPTAVAVWRTLIPLSGEQDEKAGLLNNLSVDLSEAGDRRGALKASQEAAEIYRKLAEASLDRFMPNLALSLNNLSNRLSEAGDRRGALKASQEAAEIYRKLAEASPDRFMPDLAGSLNTLSNRLSEAGDRRGALKASQESVDIRRKLAETSPDRFMPNLALSLNNLSNRLSEAGDRLGALKASPDRFMPDLAGSLNNLSNRLSEAGDRRGALKASQESVDIRRKLAETSPDRFMPNLALSLNNLSNRLSEAGDRRGALKASQESVDIRRKLAEASPDRFMPNLALSLNNLSNRLSEAGDRRGALKASQEAAEIQRTLAEVNPDRSESEGRP